MFEPTDPVPVSSKVGGRRNRPVRSTLINRRILFWAESRHRSERMLGRGRLVVVYRTVRRRLSRRRFSRLSLDVRGVRMIGSILVAIADNLGNRAMSGFATGDMYAGRKETLTHPSVGENAGLIPIGYSAELHRWQRSAIVRWSTLPKPPVADPSAMAKPKTTLLTRWQLADVVRGHVWEFQRQGNAHRMG